MRLPNFGSMGTVRRILLIIWFGSFTANAIAVIALWHRQWIEGDTAKAAIKGLFALYSPYVAAMIAFFYGKRTADNETVAPHAGIIAALGSLLWNGIALWLFLPLLTGHRSIESATEDAQELIPTFAWLVAGAIGYYFAGPEPSNKGAS